MQVRYSPAGAGAVDRTQLEKPWRPAPHPHSYHLAASQARQRNSQRSLGGSAGAARQPDRRGDGGPSRRGIGHRRPHRFSGDRERRAPGSSARSTSTGPPPAPAGCSGRQGRSRAHRGRRRQLRRSMSMRDHGRWWPSAASITPRSARSSRSATCRPAFRYRPPKSPFTTADHSASSCYRRGPTSPAEARDTPFDTAEGGFWCIWVHSGV